MTKTFEPWKVPKLRIFIDLEIESFCWFSLQNGYLSNWCENKKKSSTKYIQTGKFDKPRLPQFRAISSESRPISRGGPGLHCVPGTLALSLPFAISPLSLLFQLSVLSVHSFFFLSRFILYLFFVHFLSTAWCCFRPIKKCPIESQHLHPADCLWTHFGSEDTP